MNPSDRLNAINQEFIIQENKEEIETVHWICSCPECGSLEYYKGTDICVRCNRNTWGCLINKER